MKSVYFGTVVEYSLLSSLYCIVPPLPPVTVTPCAEPSYIPLYAFTVGFVALALLIVIVLFPAKSLYVGSELTIYHCTVVVPASVLVGFWSVVPCV